MIKHLLKQLWLIIDQALNVVIYLPSDGFGFADETISARSWRLREKHGLYKFINVLFFWQNNHCRGAYASEIQRKHLPSIYRKES